MATLSLGAMLAACTASPATPPPAAEETAGCESEAADAYALPEGQQQIARRAADMAFGPCPPAIPFECEMAVLEGSPKESGLFTVRFRTRQPWVMPPHSHPRAGRVTVIEGGLSVGFGTAVDKTAGKRFTAGDYYVNPAGATHYVWADEPVEIQITGIGPWEAHPHKQ